jgi:drug/metabolite transporter (DMT)-like permease
MTQGNILSFHITNIKGLLWGLLAGSSFGFFSAFSSTVSKEKQGIFLLSSVFSSLIAMAFLSLSELSLFSTITIKDIALVASLGSVVDGIGYIAWTGANRVAKERKVSISSIASLVYLLPVLSLVIVTIIFKEKTLFQPYFLIALALLLVSSIICQKASTIVEKF